MQSGIHFSVCNGWDGLDPPRFLLYTFNNAHNASDYKPRAQARPCLLIGGHGRVVFLRKV